MGIEGIGNIGNQINNLVKELGETGKIVREVFQKLNEFKAETDKNIQKDLIKSARERLEELMSKTKTANPLMNDSIDKLQKAIEDAEHQLRGGI